MQQTTLRFFLILLFVLSSQAILAQDDANSGISTTNLGNLALIADLEFSSSFSYEFSADSQFLILSLSGETSEIQIYRLDSLTDDALPFLIIAGSGYRMTKDGNWLFVTTAEELLIYELPGLNADASPLLSIPYAGSSKSYNLTSDEHWLILSIDERVTLYDITTLNADSSPVLSASGAAYRISRDNSDFVSFNRSEDELRYFDLTAETVGEGVLVATITRDFMSFGFNPSGTQLLYNSDAGIELWDIATGETRTYEWAAASDGVYWRFSDDDSALAIDVGTCRPGYCQGELRVLNLGSLEAVYTHTYDDAYINDMAFSQSGQFMAFGSSSTGSWTVGLQTGTSFTDGHVRLINLETGEEVFDIPETDGILGSILFALDDTRLIYTSIPFLSQFPEWSNAVIHVLDVSTGEDVYSFNDTGLASSIDENDPNTLKTSSTIILPGIFMFGGSTPHDVNINTGEAPDSGLDLYDAAYNQDSTLAISVSYNFETDEGKLRCYDTATQEILMELSINAVSEFSSPRLSPDDSILSVRYALGVFPDQRYHLLIFGLQ